MLFSEFMSRIESGAVPPVVLLGPGKASSQREPFEPMLAERALARLVEKYVDPSLQDLTYSIFYADETTPGNVALEAQTLPFLAERRVITVRNADRYMAMGSGPRTPLTPLLEYLKSPSPSTLLILISAQADQRKAFYKACVECGAVVECPQLNDRQLETWAKEEAARLGKRLEAAAVNELLQRAGARLGDVNNAIALVCGYVGEAETIRAADVIAACADVAEESVWALTDAIAASDTPKALAALYKLFEAGKSCDDILGIINWLLETAYRAAPQTPLQVKSSFVADKVQPLVRRLGLQKIKAACALCTDTQFMTRCTGVDRNLAVELLVIKLAWRPRTRGAA